MKRIYLTEIPSTQSFLLQNLPDSPPHLAQTVYSFHQTAGYGQAQNSWECPPDSGLAFSLAWPFPKNIKIPWVQINKHLSIGITQFLQEKIHPEFCLKWPNDLIYQNKKCGGMIMNIVSKTDCQYLVLGLGINLKPIPQIKTATSIQEINPKTLDDPHAFCLDLCNYLNAFLKKEPSHSIENDYNSCLWRLQDLACISIDFPEKFKNSPETITAKILGADSFGRIIIETDMGVLHLHHGQARIQLPQN